LANHLARLAAIDLDVCGSKSNGRQKKMWVMTRVSTRGFAAKIFPSPGRDGRKLEANFFFVAAGVRRL